MKLFDRLLIRSYIKAYIYCLISILSLYIVVDLFTHIDDFAEHHSGLNAILKHIASYYGVMIAQYFDRLCEVIALMAGAFTVAMIQRNNELMPLLSAGMRTQRVVMPVMVAACGMLSLSIVNQEFIIPRIANFLMNDRDDPNGTKEIVIRGAYEPNGIHIEGRIASRQGMVVRDNDPHNPGFFVVIPESLAGALIKLDAQEARYIPRGDGKLSGGWLLTGVNPPELTEWNWNRPEILQMIDPGKYFLHTQEVDFDMVTRSQNWYQFASTRRLQHELSKPESTRLAAMAVLFHMRLTRPLLGVIFVLMGMSVILRDQNRNVFISTAMCLGLCAVFFAAQFTCKNLGESDYLSPALAAWLPVLFFGPFCLALFDAVHT
jgi:lipopolysaccharide export system permease protein